MRRLLAVGAILALSLIVSAGSATAAKPKCPYDYTQGDSSAPACRRTHSTGGEMDRLRISSGRYPQGTRHVRSLSSKRALYLQALIYSKLPRIKKRNRLIDFVGAVDRYCYPGEYLACGEIEQAEREIRKLAP